MKLVAAGEVLPETAAAKLRGLPYEDIGIAKIDGHRELRTGRAEVIYGLSKTPQQTAAIMKKLADESSPVLATKVGTETFEVTAKALGDGWTAKAAAFSDGEAYVDLVEGTLSAKANVLSYFKDAGLLVAASAKADVPESAGEVAVLCAGTADIPVAEEAAIAARVYGSRVQRHYDVGVAGIHRLLSKVEDLATADVLIVVAGMEGALPSVVGGLASVPVIAVPTSVGYGASMGGLTALFAMLAGCSLGVSVVNIDNGFGAGYQASLIAKR
jgi:NCAIR mutase (PurE)-related protein